MIYRFPKPFIWKGKKYPSPIFVEGEEGEFELALKEYCAPKEEEPKEKKITKNK